MAKTLMEIKNLVKYFPLSGGIFKKAIANVHAVDGITLTIKQGETLGLVGESGCGKSTLGKTILNLHSATSGSVLFEGKNIFELPTNEMRSLRADMQMIFQDPAESLNSRHTIGRIVEEPLIIHNIGDKKSRKKKVRQLLKRVGIDPSFIDRYPHEFSGGQKQRIGIARAIALEPKLILCDEPVSALDVSIQSQVLNLLLELQKEMGLTYIFIAHDLSVVRHISDRIAVMYLGKVIEIAPALELCKNPRHPYTKALISAIPDPVPGNIEDFEVLQGDVPSPVTPPSGCRFHTRCPYAQSSCSSFEQKLEYIGDPRMEHLVSCHHVDSLQKRSIPY